MLEAKHQPLLPRHRFYGRMAMHLGASALLLAASLLIGMVGYVSTEGLSWIDAFLNSAMLLGGMGPVNMPATFWGKLFAGCFALYSGLVFIVCLAIVLTPLLHRILHRFHLNTK